MTKFQLYREDIVVDWHRRVLAELGPLCKPRGLEIIVTMLDGLHDDYVRPALGVDSRRIAALMRDFPFTLQVEDPARFWMMPPERYRRFAETYLKLVPDPHRLMFDVNVVDNRDITRYQFALQNGHGHRTRVDASERGGDVRTRSPIFRIFGIAKGLGHHPDGIGTPRCNERFQVASPTGRKFRPQNSNIPPTLGHWVRDGLPIGRIVARILYGEVFLRGNTQTNGLWQEPIRKAGQE